MRSVDLVVRATDINVNDKKFEENYKYTLTDGVITDDVKINNIDGMNGSITYDKNGESEYIIYNDKYCVKKTSDMEEAEITETFEAKRSVLYFICWSLPKFEIEGERNGK